MNSKRQTVLYFHSNNNDINAEQDDKRQQHSTLKQTSPERSSLERSEGDVLVNEQELYKLYKRHIIMYKNTNSFKTLSITL